MRITLERALFDAQSAPEAAALVDLLGTAVRDTHEHALVTDPVYIDGGANQEIDTWLAQRPPYEAQVFRTLLSQGPAFANRALSAPAEGPRVSSALDPTQPRTWHLSGALEIRVERRPASDWGARRLTLADAADLLREPVHLVLENDRTDLAFVRYLASPADGTRLRALLDHPGRIATHSGGSEAKPWISALAQGAPTAAKWRRVLRAWVLFDQDAGDADVRHPSATAMKFMKACEAVVAAFGPGLSWICLRRREIESYVPDTGLLAASLAAHAPIVQRVIAWRADPALAPHAWAFDLKMGLRGDLRAALPQADRKALKERTLPLAPHMLKPPFDGLTPAEVASLDGGLIDRLGHALRDAPAPTWASDIPTEYDV